MSQILITVAVVFIIFAIGATLVSFREIGRGGVAETDELMRTGVSLARLRRGNLPSQDSGSMVGTREGVIMSRNGEGDLVVTATRTISRDTN